MTMFADVGIPMIFIQWPLMFFALIPVIGVEGILVRRWVSLSREQAFSGITVANVVSTLIGVPVAWLAMLAVQYAVLLPVDMAAERWHWQLDSPLFEVVGFALSVAWIAPFEAYWTVPAAAALLLFPSFYVSVWIERRVCLRSWPTADKAAVRRGVYLANVGSYGLLFLLGCGWTVVALLTRKPAA